MKGQRLAPEVLVINLDDEIGRFRSISRQLEELGLSCRRVPAIDGSRLPEAERDAAYSPSLNADTYYKELSAGEVGAYLSHIRAWRTIMDEDLDHAVILEDDSVVDPSFAALGSLLEGLRGWDYIKLTGPRGGKRIRDAVPLGDRHRLVYYEKVPTGAYAQVVSRRGAERLLTSSRPFGRPVDVDIQHPWEKDIHVLGIEPAMVGHDPAFPSAITARAGGTGRQRKSSFLRRLRFRLSYEWRTRTRSRPPLESFLVPKSLRPTMPGDDPDRDRTPSTSPSGSAAPRGGPGSDRPEASPMRLAVVNAARNYGGQEAMAALLAVRLAQRGHRVTFVCRPVFPALERVQGHVPVAPVLGAMDWSPLGIARSRRLLRKQDIEVVLATTNKDMRSAAVAAWTLGIPVVVRRAMARPLRDNLHYRFLYGRIPAHIITNSEATRRIMLDSAPWLDPARTSVVYNGIDPRPFRVAEPAELGVPPDGIAVGFVGRFVEWKGVLTVADAWRRLAQRLPDAHLVLAGEGEMEPEMRSRLAGVERVHWVGFREDVPAVMNALDVVVFPSTMEGFGLVAVEAMAAGVPVVAARAAALPEVVGHEAEGLLVPPEDAGALAAAMERLLKDPGLRRRLGHAGRERVERDFGEERMVDRYEQALRKAASR